MRFNYYTIILLSCNLMVTHYWFYCMRKGNIGKLAKGTTYSSDMDQCRKWDCELSLPEMILTSDYEYYFKNIKLESK